MRALLIADMEGVIGVADFSNPMHNNELMTAEMERVVSALNILCVTDITICDAHDRGENIIRERFKNLTHNDNGVAFVAQLWNIDFGTAFDFAILTGYHGMAGSEGVLPHTIRPDIVKATADCMEIGEVGIIMRWLREMRVPVVFVSGDNAAASEALSEDASVNVLSVKSHDQILLDEYIYDLLEEVVSLAVQRFFVSPRSIEPAEPTKICIYIDNDDSFAYLSSGGQTIEQGRLAYKSCSDLINSLQALCEDLNRASEANISVNIAFADKLRKEFFDLDITRNKNELLKQLLSKTPRTLTRIDREYIYQELKIAEVAFGRTK